MSEDAPDDSGPAKRGAGEAPRTAPSPPPPAAIGAAPPPASIGAPARPHPIGGEAAPDPAPAPGGDGRDEARAAALAQGAADAAPERAGAHRRPLPSRRRLAVGLALLGAALGAAAALLALA